MHRIGDIIDERYQLSRPLGVRQGAEMWEAEHQVVGRKVTLKLVTLEVSSDVVARRRLVCEARAAAEIGHASVVEIYDVGVTPEGVAYLVTEPLRGETLADVVARHGAMQPEDACQVMLQVLAGLEAAHAASIVHGDLRSESVILRRGQTGQLVVKLLDFGVSEPSLQTMTAPPASESRATGRTIDPTADLQSAGALLYEMLSGRSAIRAGTAQESNGGHVAPSATSLVPAIPAGLARIVDQAMSTAAVRSIVTAKDMAGMLAPFAVSDREPSIAPRDTMMPFLSPEARKSRGMARLEKAVLGASVRPNLVVIERTSRNPAAEYASRSPIAFEGSQRAPGPESMRHMNPEDLLEPRIPKAPRYPKHLGSNLPRFSRPDRLERVGPRPQKRSSLPLRKWKASQPVLTHPTVSEQAPLVSPAPPPLASSSLWRCRFGRPGSSRPRGSGAGLLLARLLHL